MNKKEAAPLVTQREPQMGGETQLSQPMPIVPHLPADVKAILDLTQQRHIPTADIVELVKTLYPKFDRFLLSRCAHGNETGVSLRTDALKALLIHFAEDGQKAISEKRKRPNRCQCRLTDTVYEQTQTRIRERGQTMQDYLEELILRDLTGGNDNGQCDEHH